MKVLVIGGSGYLGSVLVPKLISSGYEVTSVDLNLFGDHLPNNVNKITGDIRDETLMKKEIEKADAIINLAAIVGPPLCEVLPNFAYETNYSVMKKIIRLVKNKKYIYTSTCSVYGFEDDIFLDEDIIKFYPISHYAITKAKAEALINEQMPNATIFRLGTLFGYSPRMRYDLVTNIFIAQALNNQNITVNGGDQWRPMTHVEDVAEGIIWSLERELNGIYNLSYNNYTIKLIAEIISSKLNVPFIISNEISEDSNRNVLVKNRKLSNKGFKAKRNILDAIKPIKESNTWKDWTNMLYNNGKMGSVLNEKYL